MLRKSSCLFLSASCCANSHRENTQIHLPHGLVDHTTKLVKNWSAEKNSDKVESLADSEFVLSPQRGNCTLAQKLLRRSLHMPFSDLAAMWKVVMENPQLLDRFCKIMSVREVQLLNAKISWDADRLYAAASGDELALERFPKTPDPNSPHTKERKKKVPFDYLKHYSFAHYAAELGDVDFFRFLEKYPDDLVFVPLHKRYSGTENCTLASPSSSSMMMMNTGCVVREEHDYTGRFVSHHAAMCGNVDLLSYVSKTYGEDLILSEQRAQKPFFKDMEWGTARHLIGLNAVESCVGVGQMETLAWLLKQHRGRLRDAFPEGTARGKIRSALASAAMMNSSEVFEFLVANGMLSTGASGAVGGAWLDESHLYYPLLAAAEEGSEDVVNWFLDTFGADVVFRYRNGKGGAGVLHHCARGAHSAMLRNLVTRNDFPLETIDELDDNGRSPAMWCVMAAKGLSAKNVIETLDTLRSLGSKWPMARDFNQESTLQVALRSLSPHSNVCRFLRKWTL